MPFKQANVVVSGLVFTPAAPGDRPDHTLPGDQPEPEHPIYVPIVPPDLGIWPGGTPTHPIYIPVPPLGIWGGANEPMPTPPIELPGIEPPDPPGTWGGSGEGFPTPPIYLPVPPPDGGGGGPGDGGPGDGDAHVEHPIYWPVEIWGPTDPRPTPPIELPDWVPPLTDDAKQKLIDFLFGHLPPAAQPV